MKLNFLKLFKVFVSLSVVVSQVAVADPAGLFLKPSVFFDRSSYDDATSGGTGKTTTTRYLFNMGLGYIFGGWAYVGADLNYFKSNTESTANSGATSKSEVTLNEYGPTFGYMGDHWHFLGTYLVFAQRDATVTTTSSTTTARTGGGYMASLGYRFDLGGSTAIGPSLIYKSITYVNCKDTASGATQTCSPSVKSEDLLPFFTLTFNFK